VANFHPQCRNFLGGDARFKRNVVHLTEQEAPEGDGDRGEGWEGAALRPYLRCPWENLQGISVLDDSDQDGDDRQNE
jgi:hypothetical protein